MSTTQKTTVDTAAVASPFRDPVHTPNFDRQIDSTVIVVRSNTLLSTVAVANAISPWLRDGGFEPSSYVIEGGELSKRRFIRFRGLPAIAQAAVATMLRRLRAPDGEWVHLEARGADNILYPIYIGPDKNGKQTRTEIESKKLRDLLKSKHPDLVFHRNPATGVISTGHQQLVRVEPVAGDEPSKLFWSLETAAANRIDVQDFKRIFRENIDAHTKTKWTEA